MPQYVPPLACRYEQYKAREQERAAAAAAAREQQQQGQAAALLQLTHAVLGLVPRQR